MQIYFANIRYLGIPIIWEYDEATNKATCLFKLTDTTRIVNKISMITSLRDLEGLIVNDDTHEVIIDDALRFFKSNQMTRFEQTPVVPPLSLQSISIGGEKEPAFFSRKLPKPPTHRTSPVPALISSSSTFELPPSLDSIPSCSSTTLVIESTESQSTDDKGFDLEVKNGIWLNTIFPKTENADLTKWSNTRAHEGYFEGKTREDEEERLSSPLVSLQYNKNHELYPIKSKQMALVRSLFDQILAPIYEQMNEGRPAPSQLIGFFQNAIEGLMLNGRFNSGPTEYEKMSEEERAEKFGDDELAYEDAVLEARRARARVMLRPLRYFTSDLLLQFKDETLRRDLELLKFAARSKRQTIDCIINELETLIIDSGKVEFKFAQLFNKLISQLSRKDDVKDEIIEEQESCSHQVHSFLLLTLLAAHDETKKKSKARQREKAKINEIAAEVVRSAIQAIRNDPAFIDSPHIPGGNDFYFSKELCLVFQNGLPAYFNKELETRKFAKSKHNKKEKIAIIKDYVVDFIGKQLRAVPLQPSSSSSSPQNPEMRIPTPRTPRTLISSIFTRQPSARVVDKKAADPSTNFNI
ncbi:hypothetical protein BN59_02584 [Legionella massiliensis]|uniref:Uncharacterized protein n=1 Tax=Legionella massiliensis TaxID=1034943 RepID=A0A078L2E5_9GAMM|nr:hypothetical protein [Legionella massiliensis]CDZ78274.1 hypothetical protein BN59_02584 [Legionella massiliensis]CEE14012.1 hypothetical protein BN1094_02584 [Legionella massiliensis]